MANERSLMEEHDAIFLGCSEFSLDPLMLLAVGTFWGVQFFLKPSMATIVTIILGIFALIITINIAYNQIKQLNKLKDIANKTGETVNKLKTDSRIYDRINKFFLFEEGKNGKYKCYFPVEYRSKPLPLINQGDFYAIHVLSSRLGDDNLELIGITKNESVNMDSLKGNVIFICSPTANPALKAQYDMKEIKNEEDMNNIKKWPLDGLDLPCWFVEDFRGRKNGRSVRKIKIYDGDINELLISSAEDSYDEAIKLDEGDKYEYSYGVQQDYGIFARIHKEDKQYIILAGVHQYGTWIIGSLLSNLFYVKNIDYVNTFLSNNDFICVITGEFNNRKMTVNEGSISVSKQYMWIKKDDKWIRKYRRKEEQIAGDFEKSKRK